MTTDINIKEVIESEDSLYNIKRFKISGTNFNIPKKSIPCPQNLSKKVYSEYYSNTDDSDFLEISKDFKLKDIVDLGNLSSGLGKKIGWANWKSENKFIITPFFEFNPYNHFTNLNSISYFYDIYHTHSNFLLLIPNLKLEDTVSGKKVRITKIDDYLKFVYESHEILSFKNGKPIFVPISLRFSTNDLTKLIKEYIKNDFYYFWVDFEKNNLHLDRIGKLQHIRRLLDEELKVFDKCLFMFTNNKKDMGNSKDDKLASSEVLLPIFGANIIGINKNRKFFNPREEKDISDSEKKVQEETQKLNSGRVFNSDSYYYEKAKSVNECLSQSDALMKNTKIMNNEFKNESIDFLKEFKIKDYLSKKSMLNEYQEGKWLKNIEFNKKKPNKEKTIDDLF